MHVAYTGNQEHWRAPVAVRVQLVQLPSLIRCTEVAGGGQALDDEVDLPRGACFALFQDDLHEARECRTSIHSSQETSPPWNRDLVPVSALQAQLLRMAPLPSSRHRVYGGATRACWRHLLAGVQPGAQVGRLQGLEAVAEQRVQQRLQLVQDARQQDLHDASTFHADYQAVGVGMHTQ